MVNVWKAGAVLGELQVLQTVIALYSYYKKALIVFAVCVPLLLILVVVSLEPALLKISTADVAQQAA